MDERRVLAAAAAAELEADEGPGVFMAEEEGETRVWWKIICM